MASDKQIAAARLNGARSRGPITPEGKARAARNSTRHGTLARAILLEGESRDRFDDLVKNLNETLNPRNPIDHLLIGKMAATHWRLIRLWNLEKEGKLPPGDLEMRLDRQFYRTFDRYFKTRSFFEQTNPATPAAAIKPASPDPEFSLEREAD